MKEKLLLIVPIEIEWNPKLRKGRRGNALDLAIDIIEECDLSGGCGDGYDANSARLCGKIKVEKKS